MTKRNIVFVEISTRNHEETTKFYQQLFGWKMERVPEMNYTMWDAGDGSVGGFSPVGENTKAGDVVISINSDDIEADLKKAKSLGATILQEKMEIPQTGWYGIFKDPTGNMISLYTTMPLHS